MRQIFSPPLTLLPILISLMGCSAITPFHGTQRADVIQQEGNEPTDRVEIVIGQPDPVLRRIAYVVETPARIFPLGPKHARHKISATTAELITCYLEQNELSEMHVCVNEYDPVGEWKRLVANRSIGPGWRYTFGILSLAQYTLLPHPVFGGNQYNPFTNRLSIELDDPVALLYEAAFAKDVRAQSLPGTYAAMTMLPGISLVREIRAVNAVTKFAQAEEDWELEKEVYRKLYPRVGGGSILIGMVALPLWWEQALFGVVGPASGYVVGRMTELHREREFVSMNSALPAAKTSREPISVEQIPNWVFIEEDSTDPEARPTVGP